MTPFGAASVSLGLHPPARDPAPAQAAAMVAEAAAAEAAGFDGITVAEHHVGFPGYMPDPILACGWILAATHRAWAAPCPLVLPLRNPLLVAEALAWTAARFPGRVAAAFVPGYTAADFEALGVRYDSRGTEFAAGLEILVDALAGRGALGRDPAVATWATDPAPLLSGGNTEAAVGRAARHGLGIVFPGGESSERLRILTACYRDAGGEGPVVWIRNLWLGDPPAAAVAELEATYRGAAAAGMRQRLGFAEGQLAGPPAEVAERLVGGLASIGATALNVRFFHPAASRDDVVDQIERFGADVLPFLRSAPWAGA